MTEAGRSFARIAWGIVAGFVCLHVGSLLFYNHEKMVSEANAFAMATVERALSIHTSLRAHPELLEMLQTPLFSLVYVQEPLQSPERIWPHSDEVRVAIVAMLKGSDNGIPADVGARAAATRLWYTSRPHAPELVVQMQLGDRSWLRIRAGSPGVTQGHTLAAVFGTSILGGLVMLIVLFATRRFSRALPKITEAADRVGRESRLLPVDEAGPKELRRLTEAFNAMQARVSGLLDERRLMLGALSHDLRTLVTRLSLRMDAIADEHQRARAGQDVAAICELLDEAMDFAREDASDEQPIPVNVSSLLQSLVDDARDAGKSATWEGLDDVVVTGQPVGLRRAFGNLLDNGLRYGDSVRVRLSQVGLMIRVDLVDAGPGIPDTERTRVLLPYVRLEGSRSRDTGGSGLGLAIASNVIRRHRGTLSFVDADDGFTVRVELGSNPAA
ncbi:MAG: HAMP domain-containing histidine kinase [Pseudomonadales bacterium]|nr:HAMP domain-containing histidine kinase [Pseudomonadales bacterium]